MGPEEIYKELIAEFGEEVVFNFDDGASGAKDPWCQVAPYEIAKVCGWLKSQSNLHFDYLENLCGTDFPDDGHVQVVYHLFSYAKQHRMVLKCMLDRDDPALPTVSEVWRAANWQERECYDLLGVIFDDHPDLRRLLMPEDWVGHPMRKDYKEGESYHGIPTTRPNPVELFGLKVEAADKGDAQAS